MDIDQAKRIENLLEKQGLLHKDVLNFNEACQYLGLSKSYLYKLTSKRQIPFFKPQFKKIFFKRQDLDTWLLRNPIIPKEEVQLSEEDSQQIEQKAADYLIQKGKVKT